MNKKLAVVLAALMMLSTTTFLANSISTDVKAEAEGGATVIVDATYAAPFVEKAVAEAEADNAEVVAYTDVLVPENERPADFATKGMAVTLKFANIDADADYIVYHYIQAENKWEELTIEGLVDGAITVRMYSFSPVYIAKVEPATTSTWNPYYTMNPYGAAKLPKTGAVAVLPVAAMACLAGAVACGRKEK